MKDILKMVVLAGLFAVPFLTLYVANDNFFPFITGKNFAFRIIVEIVVAAFVLLALYEPKYRPKFSWIAVSFVALLGVMFFANLFGVHPPTSFFSNYERMDGYVTLVHVFLYFIVLGSMLTTKEQWRPYLYTTLGVAFFVSMHGLAQYSGAIAGYQGRIDGVLGNAAYMAIYMLFHIFVTFWLFVESKGTFVRVVYGLLSGLFIFTLIETGTRGTALGFLVGSSVMAAYIALFGTRFKEFRKYALGIFIFIVIAVGTLIAAKDTTFVQSNDNLSRIANISLDQLSVRTIIWTAALQGVAERPLLGWGQGNFNFIFNNYYDPALYGQEQWFDRVHNIFLDWLVTGGVLGFVAYFSLFGACLWYLFIRPLVYGDESFDVLERGVLLGILAGYLTHNLVVFDNIVSYIFFGLILALIHSRVGTPIAAIAAVKVDPKLITQFAAPVMAVVVVMVVYTLNIPGMQAATDIIDGYRATTPEGQLEAFERALSRGSFARQEIIEQLAQQAMMLSQNPNTSASTTQRFIARAEEELLAFAAEKQGDARVHVFLGSFYRAIRDNDRAAEQMAIARQLSPKKQSIIAQQAAIELSRGDYEAATAFFKEAFELYEENLEARENYAASLFYLGRPDEAKALMIDDVVKRRFAQSDFLVNAANAAGETTFLTELYEVRVAEDSANAQHWASLAFLYYQNNERDRALDALSRASEAIPTFSRTATCISDNIRNNREPQEGC